MCWTKQIFGQPICLTISLYEFQEIIKFFVFVLLDIFPANPCHSCTTLTSTQSSEWRALHHTLNYCSQPSGVSTNSPSPFDSTSDFAIQLTGSTAQLRLIFLCQTKQNFNTLNAAQIHIAQCKQFPIESNVQTTSSHFLP